MKVSKKVKIFSIVAVVFVGLYALVGFFLIPYLITNYLPKKLQQEAHINTSFKEARFNPFTFKLDLKEPTLFDTKKTPMFQTKEFHTQLNMTKIFSKIIDFENVNFIEPKVFATIEKNGKSNFASLRDQNSSQESNTSSKSAWNFIINNFNIKDGYISFTDKRREKPITFELKPINYRAKNISSIRGKKSPQTLITQSKTANHVSIDGDLILNPLNAAGKINIQGLKIDEIWDYGIGKGTLYPKGAIADISLNYTTDTTSKNSFHALINDIKITIKNTQIIDKTTKLATIDTIALDKFKVEANITQKSSLITLSQGDIKLDKINLYDSNQTSFITSLHVNNLLLSYDFKNLLQSSIASFNIKGATLKNPSFSGNFDTFSLNDIDVKAIFDENGSLALRSKEMKLYNSNFLQPSLLQTSLGDVNMENFTLKYNLKDKIQSTINSFNVKKIAIELQEEIAPYDGNFDSLELKNIAFKGSFDTNGSFLVGSQNIELKNSTLTNTNLQNPPLHVNTIALNDFNLSNNTLELKSLKIADGKLLASLEKDGSFDFLQGIKTQEKTQENSKASADFHYDIKNLSLNNFALQFQDKTLKKPFTQKLDVSDFTVSNFANKAKANFSLKANTPNIKSLALKGTLTQNPLHVKGNIALSNSNLTHFQNYIQEYTNMVLTSGVLNIKGNFALQNDKQLKFTFNNDIKLDNIDIQKNDKSDLASWKSLHVKGFNYQHKKQKLYIKEALLTEPKTALIISKNGSTNFENLTSKTKNQKPKTTQEKSSFEVGIDKFNVQSGAIKIQNKSLISEGLTDLSKIKIIAKDFTTSDNKLLKAKASATVNNSGYFALNSALNINDLKKDTQFDIILKGVSLVSLSSYTKNYLGYDMKQGTLTSTITQRINNGKLSGENKIGLNQIKLGDTVKSKDAISVPLEAALLLLKDSSGDVELDVPVSGNLNDPSFSYGSIVIKAFTNIITGIVTAPFSILGNLLGIDGKELKTVDFEPSSTALVASEEAKMKQYAQILQQKPSLKLTITGAYDSSVDFKKASLDENSTTSQSEEPQKVDKKMLLDLANKRALAIQNLLIKEGIDKNRVIVKPSTSKSSRQGLWIQCEIGVEQ